MKYWEFSMQVQDWLSANAEEGIIIEERTSKESQIPLPAEFLEEGIDGDDVAVVLSLVKDRQEYIIFADIMLKDLFRQYRVENWNAVLSVLRKILSEAGMLRRKVKTLDECRKQLPAELLPLFDELRRVRAKKSRETGMPAYAVASNVSLEMICRELPDSMESLRKIKGMGPKNSAICGEEFISCIEKHKKGAGSKEAGSSETAG